MRKKLRSNRLLIKRLAGAPVLALGSAAPGGVALGGVRLSTATFGFARPSGTEGVYKIHADGFLTSGHLRSIQLEAQSLIGGFSGVPEPMAGKAGGSGPLGLAARYGGAACYG